MSHLGVIVFILGIASVSMILVKPYPPSCLHIKKTAPHALSGLYDIAIDNTVVTVYCEMILHGGGFTFIPRDAVRKGKLPNLVRQLCTNPTNVLLRFQQKNGLQPQTLIGQLPGIHFKLGIRMHNFNGYTRPLNQALGDYLYLGMLPAVAARNKNQQGFSSNGQRITFRNCDKNPNSYFAFFPNHREQLINNYHNNNLYYERHGVAVKWRKSGIPSYGHRQVPEDFFFLTEMHIGGCGCYTSSDRWLDAYGTAIGLR